MNINVMDEPIETIHLYVVREEEKKPFVFLPLCAAVLCLACIVGLTIYSGYHPAYEHETRVIPAHFLPLQAFSAISIGSSAFAGPQAFNAMYSGSSAFAGPQAFGAAYSGSITFTGASSEVATRIRP